MPNPTSCSFSVIAAALARQHIVTLSITSQPSRKLYCSKRRLFLESPCDHDIYIMTEGLHSAMSSMVHEKVTKTLHPAAEEVRKFGP